ncbi:di-heme oxidoredictase family protein [Jeongeupia sp. USM3]|uniref:di-heme oxidoreductase family protein n=1 Tax=Jeongeupia sp. USM3 TaxID=1906741 RepID=UPI00089DE365|nr:di-heme oxidoredictase family protein [Jeongeupia sp. USM3]AOY00719.1 thiol oxidoreductase [Jeongeupia sp. USM3]
MNKAWILGVAVASGVTLAAYETVFEAGEDLPGGVAATIDDHGKNAFSLPAPGLSEAQKTDFVVGNSFFKKAWVEAPSSTTARDGLGPHFIARSCGACHALDGRGAPPDFDRDIQAEQPMALLIRLSVPGTDAHGGPKPEPVYGGQFNNDAVGGVKPEGQVQIRYTGVGGRFADGTPYTLQKPDYTLTGLGYGPLHKDTMLSPRIAPQMIGLGLLEAVRVDDVLANARRQAAEGRGIRGEPNWVWDAFAGKTVLGRYGWKANVGSVAHQSAGAFIGDIGITSKRFAHEECTAAQTDCRRAPSGGRPEIDDRKLAQVVLYSQTLAVPSRRDPQDSAVLRGKQVFRDANCVSCHTPSYTTGRHPTVPQLSGQKIWPYTDLLLHDMGDGLADGRPDYKAGGRQWKTPPLWGLGLVPTVNGHSRYLHDGRARDLMEAVLWHGGEAAASRDHVLKLNRQDRDNLVAFLQSL